MAQPAGRLHDKKRYAKSTLYNFSGELSEAVFRWLQGFRHGGSRNRNIRENVFQIRTRKAHEAKNHRKLSHDNPPGTRKFRQRLRHGAVITP